LTLPHKWTASDCETRVIGVGEIFLIEDVHGKAISLEALGKFLHSVMIPID